MSILKLNKETFGTLYNGKKVDIYTISNGSMSFSVTNYGCTITSILVPDSKGNFKDVVLGYSTLEGYCYSDLYFGALVGRVANRIKDGKFSLDLTEYNLDKNNGGNCLHGGYSGFDKIVWDAKKIKNQNGLGLEFTHFSKDGEQGFPGNVMFKVIYTLNESNEITLEYFASTDKKTPVNLTNHCYFNLNGYSGGSVDALQLQLNCSKYVEIDKDNIPTGNLNSVKKDKAFDFTVPKVIGTDMNLLENGLDHAFCIDAYGNGKMNHVGTLNNLQNNLTMDIYTTNPAVHVYTANFIEGAKGKNGYVHHKRDAICFEAEYYPDSVNHNDFPSTIVEPGKNYHEKTVYKFGY